MAGQLLLLSPYSPGPAVLIPAILLKRDSGGGDTIVKEWFHREATCHLICA